MTQEESTEEPECCRKPMELFVSTKTGEELWYCRECDNSYLG